MVSFTNDDDFVFFHVPPPGVAAVTDADITELVSRLQDHVGGRIEAAHGEEIASLFEIYVGMAHVYYNPKIRLQRLIYRGIREAANAAKSVEERERGRRVEDLRRSLRERAVYIDLHPILVADTRQVYGYEALARGTLRTLRSPEIMFDVAAEADLLWELGRLCRSKAIEAMRERLTRGELLFLNVDPHDFVDPEFSQLDREVADPQRVVIEITERTAIKDYPKFRERLKALRERGYRFAVDDAGSGYAGLGSIANLEPDFIKLDISLINCIDTNFIKQNLVETMVRFANDQGAKVIAEGVERAEEYETVKGLGVHLVQGFFLHRPSENARVADDRRNAGGCARRTPLLVWVVARSPAREQNGAVNRGSERRNPRRRSGTSSKRQAQRGVESETPAVRALPPFGIGASRNWRVRDSRCRHSARYGLRCTSVLSLR